RPDERADELEQCRLPASGWADEGDEFVLFDRETDLVEGRYPPVARGVSFVETLDVDLTHCDATRLDVVGTRGAGGAIRARSSRRQGRETAGAAQPDQP